MKLPYSLERISSHIIIIWISTIIIFLSNIIAKDDSNNRIFKFGPNKNFYILNICIDNNEKYFTVFSFCFINSAIRTMHHNVIKPWITNQVQDINNTILINHTKAYELSSVSTIFIWFDFFMYMNIILSQIDMLIIETTIDLIMVLFVTKYYFNLKTAAQNGLENKDEIVA